MPPQDADRPADPPDSAPPFNLVGIGASAGGIRALKAFFEDIPSDTGIVFVVIMHLSPEHESNLAEVLQPAVRMPVRQVRGRVPMEPGHVYVIPPDRSMAVTDGHLELAEFAEPRGRRAPIDMFFRTVADAHADGVGVLLSGSGTDGVVGLKSIKEKGGIILAQSPDDADYGGMPRGAVATGLVDFVLPARELGVKVVELRAKGLPWSPPGREEELEDGQSEELHRILHQLQARTGHDFAGYKKSTILRRLSRRMQVTQCSSLGGYLDYLRSSAPEAKALLKDLLISVTSFFRDPESFRALEEKAISDVVGGKGPGGEVRVWVPGCATGEELYAIAMLLEERVSAMGSRPRIQIFGTDLDEEALGYAREALYPEAIAADVSEDRLNRFFRREGSYYRVRQELRDTVLFSPHSLLRDPPFSRLDLVSCRNLLIYLESEMQDRAFEIFGYALRDDGYLFLGTSESLGQARTTFRAVDKTHRIYRRDPGRRQHLEHLPELPLSLSRHHHRTGLRPDPGGLPAAGSFDVELHRNVLERLAPPSVLVDEGHSIIHVSDSANRYLEFPAGSPTADLLRVARKELRLEMRSALFRAREGGEPVRSDPVIVEIGGRPRRVHLHVSPVGTSGDEEEGALVVFLESAAGESGEQDATEADAFRTQKIEETEEALAAVWRRLQEEVEQSETRQEELKASNEELQSINEEYKSTLEELETSKEELQSMNEELKTVNDELTEKVEALARANDDLRNLMAATEIPTLFLDRTLRIKRFTPGIARLFNVRESDEGRPLGDLTHGLEYDRLPEDCERVLETLHPVEREARDGEDSHYLVRITPYRTENDRVDGVVATFTDVTRLHRARERVERSAERFRSLVEATAQIVWTTDPRGKVVEDSPYWRAFTGQTEADWVASAWFDVVHPDDREEAARSWRRAVEREEVLDKELRLWNAPKEEWRTNSVRVVPVRDPEGEVREWVGMSTDITERKEAEEALRRAKTEAEEADRAKTQFLSTLSHELRTPLNAVIGLADLMTSGVDGPINETQRTHLERIQRSAWHQLAMIEEILSYSRSSAGRDEVHLESTDVAEIVRQVVEMLEEEATKKGVELEARGADESVVFLTDGRKFRQIVTNLVGNGVKFTSDGSVEIALAATPEELRLIVQDTGDGIASDQLDRIFDPFVQADASTTRVRGGTGLGLAVSRRFARALGGDVEVESAPGDGSTFTVRLPRREVGSPTT